MKIEKAIALAVVGAALVAPAAAQAKTVHCPNDTSDPTYTASKIVATDVRTGYLVGDHVLPTNVCSVAHMIETAGSSFVEHDSNAVPHWLGVAPFRWKLTWVAVPTPGLTTAYVTARHGRQTVTWTWASLYQ